MYGDTIGEPFDWAAFEIKSDNTSDTISVDRETAGKKTDVLNSDRHYRLGLFVKDLIYAYGNLVLYFDETDQRFKFCYNNGRGNCGNRDYGNLVLMENAIDANVAYIYSIKRMPIFPSSDGLPAGEFCIVFDQNEDGRYNAFICKGNERLSLTKSDYDLLLISVLKTLRQKDQQKIEFSQIGLSKQNYYSAIRTFEKTVREYDLNKILEDLHVFVEEDFVSRVGRDDYYYVYKTVSIGYPVDKLDDYLKDYIGLGRRRIHEDHGYTSAYGMAIKGLITGEYDSENLRKEREKLISNYSRQDHIYYLLYQHITNSVYPKGLMYPSHVTNAISIERNSLLPLFWKLLRSKRISEYIDKLDSNNKYKELNIDSLSEINEILAVYSSQTKNYRDTECWESDPMYTIL